MRIRIIILAMLLICCYFLGQVHCEKKVVANQIEVIKYVKTKESKVLAAPHASKATLLELMRHGKL